ncbi:MAG: hypothetical protein JST43_04275 [Bacteroidetes bacterium]|nr:hypothetical protein [Bacteroidota bacterium]MBS1539962.1 hypothetical protein [Bacteroidota bacterium]
MITSARHSYNASFSEKEYQLFLSDLNSSAHHIVPFRVAESPVFVSRHFKKKLLAASEQIIDFITTDNFKKITERAIPKNLFVPHETNHTHFLALDFAVVKNQAGELEPQLIEMQGFPSLFGWQDFLAAKYREHFSVPENYFNHFELTRSDYQQLIKKIMLGGHDAEHVVLLEIEPMKQNTAVDFLISQQMTGVAPVDIADVKREGRKLYYLKNGQKILIERIYNRVIFDELIKRKDLQLQFNLTEDVEVEWAGHPNWFFRISKFTMPFLKSPFVPECKFLSDYQSFPADLENYVLKPLFSFSGAGVIFHVKQSDLESIPVSERENFLLQRKIQYEPVIQAPDGLVKTEIRLLFVWEENKPRPVLVTNLARLSRGEMIGVKFNKDKTWVGGSVCFFEPD